jgi:hypothetical protein
VVAAFAGLSVFNAVIFYIGFVYLVSWLQNRWWHSAFALARDQHVQHGGVAASANRCRMVK